MSDVLNFRTSDDLLHFDLEAENLPKTIIMHSSVLLPLINVEGLTVDAAFEIRDAETMPYNMRKRYLHPGKYSFSSFAPEVIKQLKDLKLYVKRGNNVVFVVDTEKANSLFNACSFLGEVFNNCAHHPDSPYPDFTDVPFPLRLSISKPQAWLWSCHWPQKFQGTIDTPEEAKSFAELNNNLHFPEYDGHHCCIEVMKRTSEGVIAFSVNASRPEGKIYVYPDTPNLQENLLEIGIDIQDNVFLFVEEIQACLSKTRDPARVKLRLKHQDLDVVAPGITFLTLLRFLMMLYTSQGDDSLAFKLKKESKKRHELDELVILNDGRPREFIYGFLFNTENNTLSKNFQKTLSDVEESCLAREIFSSDEQYADIHRLILNREVRADREQTAGFFVEKLQNIQIRFSSSAIDTFEKLEIDENTDDSRLKTLIPLLDDMKEEILPLIR